MPFAYGLAFKKAVRFDHAWLFRCYAVISSFVVTLVSRVLTFARSCILLAKNSTILRATAPHYVDVVARFV